MQIFDGHNDLLTQLYMSGESSAFATGLPGHIDLPKVRTGHLVGGFCAIWVPSQGDLAQLTAEMRKPSYDLPLPPEIPCQEAQPVALAQAKCLLRLQSEGHVTICTSSEQIREAVGSGRFAAILHLEGAESIDVGFRMLEQLYDLGLRSLGPVWSRPTSFGHGVPFRYPSSPDTGPGLTLAGRDLVERCNEKGILIDLSHMNEAGFWDVQEISAVPLVATHSNAHAVCPHSRNLTDAQLCAIGDSGGVVGLNFATAMLRPDGKMLPEVAFDVMLAHLDHMIEKAGADSVALGSDFDGAIVPKAIGDASGMPNLIQAMEVHGYSAELIEKIAFDNWLRVLDATWH